jgi:hypothetical protein
MDEKCIGSISGGAIRHFIPSMMIQARFGFVRFFQSMKPTNAMESNMMSDTNFDDSKSEQKVQENIDKAVEDAKCLHFATLDEVKEAFRQV